MIDQDKQPFAYPLTKETVLAINTVLTHLTGSTSSKDRSDILEKMYLAMINMVIADSRIKALQDTRTT